MAYKGAEDKKKAQNALNDYERQSLDNAFENIKISTIGSDLIREESGRTSANLVDASRNAGIRGILGGIPKIQSFTNTENQEARKYLDDQVIKREYAIAGDETDLRGMRENRDNSNIAALSSQVQKGDAEMMNGISGVAKGLQYGANNIDFGIEDDAGNTGSYAERQAKRVNQSSGTAGVPTYGKAVYPSNNPWRFGPMAPSPVATTSQASDIGLNSDFDSDLINKYQF